MIRISHIQASSYVDGPGQRAVLFVQGCPIACAGCQNTHLWSNSGGKLEHEADVAKTLADLSEHHGNITISGGDPFAQPIQLNRLIERLREYETVKNIIVYTGYLFEDLLEGIHSSTQALKHIDILVDGPFIRGMDDELIIYRGSRNQRPIDVQESLKQGKTIVLDWDNPEIVITNSGNMLMPVGLVPDFQDLGEVKTTRRCGQTKK